MFKSWVIAEVGPDTYYLLLHLLAGINTWIPHDSGNTWVSVESWHMTLTGSPRLWLFGWGLCIVCSQSTPTGEVLLIFLQLMLKQYCFSCVSTASAHSSQLLHLSAFCLTSTQTIHLFKRLQMFFTEAKGIWREQQHHQINSINAAFIWILFWFNHKVIRLDS